MKTLSAALATFRLLSCSLAYLLACLLAALAVPRAGADAPAPAAKPQTRPNIVFFLVDDMGSQDCSLPFWSETTALNKRYRTPNLELLAQGGTTFTQAYACAVCSPSRTSLMTGQNAARHGVTCWTLRKNVSPEPANPKNVWKPAAWPYNGMCPDAGCERSFVCEQTLPRLLHDAGYFTIHCGKAHWGAKGTSGAEPKNFGFDVNIAGSYMGGPGSYWGEKNYSARWRGDDGIWDIPGLEKYHGTATYLTEALTRESLATLDALPKDKPFYLYLAHYAVHAPFEADPIYLKKYQDMGLSKHDADYASMVESMDHSLGQVRQWLKASGQLDNTLFVFMSDNGSPSQNPRNLPLRGFKISCYEGGTRVPMVVCLPAAMRPAGGQVARQSDPVIIEDIFPTFLEAAGVDWAKVVKHPVDGRSFLPLTQHAQAAPPRDLLWHYPNTYDQAPWSSLRRGDFKLIWKHAGTLELYDLSKDIGEAHDLAKAQPEKVRELAKAMTDLLKARGGLRPTKNGQPVAWPDEL